MKRLQYIFLVFLAVYIFSGCGNESSYNPDDFIGKTSIEIEEEFGNFECCGTDADENGLYKETFCGYVIREAEKGFLGTEPELLIFIRFDENGTAYETYEGNRPGG